MERCESTQKHKLVNCPDEALVCEISCLGKPNCFPISQDTIRVEWNNCKQNHIQYRANEVQYKSPNEKSWSGIPVHDNDTQFDVNNLSDNVSYCFRIRYLNNNKEHLFGEESNPVSTSVNALDFKTADNKVHELDLIENSSTQSEPEIYIPPGPAADSNTPSIIGGSDSDSVTAATKFTSSDLKNKNDQKLDIVSEETNSERNESLSNNWSKEDCSVNILPPSKPVCEPINNRGIKVTWKPVTNQNLTQCYEVRYREVSEKNMGWKSISTRGNECSINIYHLEERKPLCFKVRAIYDETEGPFSEVSCPVLLIKDDTLNLPGAPEIVEKTSSSISLKWAQPTKTTGDINCYEIKFKTTDPVVKRWQSDWTKYDETEIIIDKLEDDTEYVFKIRAMIDGEDGPFSELLTSRTKLQDMRPCPPKKISSTINSISVSLECKDADTRKCTQLEIRYRSAKTGLRWFPLFIESSQKRVTIQNLKSGTDYEVKVRELFDEIESPFSETSVMSTTTEDNNSSDKHCLIVEDIQDTSVTVTWNHFAEDIKNTELIEIRYRKQGEQWYSKSFAKNENQCILKGLVPFSTYDIMMHAVQDGTNNIFSKTQEVKTKPLQQRELKPILPVVVETTTQSIEIRWEPSSVDNKPVLHYEIRCKPCHGTQHECLIYHSTECKMTIGNLNAGTEYEFIIRAIYTKEVGPFSDVIIISTESINEDVVVLETKEISFEYVSLYWMKPGCARNINSYVVKYRKCPKGKWVVFSTANNETTVSGLDEGTSYEFVIRAIFDETEGPASQGKKITTLVEDQQVKNRRPGVLESKVVSFDCIQIQWEPPDDSVGLNFYEVQYKPKNKCEWNVHTSYTTITTLLNLQQSTNYNVIVRGVYNDNLGPFSAVVELYTVSKDDVHKNDPPGTPEEISSGYCHVKLKWSKQKSWMKQIDHYEVEYVHLVEKGIDETLNKIECPLEEYTLQALEPSMDYRFRVRGIFVDKSKTHYSKWSGKIATKNCDIENIRATEITHDKLVLIWKGPMQSEEIKCFEAIWRENVTGIDEWQTSRTKKNEVTLFGLMDSTEYNVKIRCILNHDQKSKLFNLVPNPTTKLHPEKKFPGKPILIECSARSIKLEWKACKMPRIGFYKIKYHECGTETNKWMSLCTENNRTTHTITDLRNATDYEFKVAAVMDGETGQFSEVSDKMTTNLSLARQLQVVTNFRVENGPPQKFKLPIVCYVMNRTAKTRKCVLDETVLEQADGKTRPHKKSGNPLQRFSDSVTSKKSVRERHNGYKEKTIMLVGATGSGKSTLIDGMINYITDVSWDDEFRFTLIDLLDEEKLKRGDQTISQTDWITTYRISHIQGGKLDFNLNIIDTPGFGDTRGITRDKQLVAQVKELFEARTDHGIQMIDGVCFVTQSPLSRLTQSQKYIFDSILSLFGKDIAENIFVLITFADGKRPPVLDALEKAKIPFTDSFMFNNSALFESEDSKGRFSKMFWKMGEESFQNFFHKLQTVDPKSLQLTTNVLRIRGLLEVTIEGLQEQVFVGINQLNTIKQEGEVLQRHRNDIQNNRNFNYEVEEVVMEEVRLGPGEYVTNCLTCNITCHFPCRIPEDKDKDRCKAMDGTGNCTVCPKNCHWTMHRNAGFRLEATKQKIAKTYEQLKRKFEIAKKEATSQKAVLEKVKNKFVELRKSVNDKIQAVRKCINDLEKFALRPNPLSDIEYIEQLIAAEEHDSKYGWQDRIKLLKTFREEAQMIKDAKTGTLEPFKDTEEILRSFDVYN